PKQAINIRLDEEVLAYFKQTGKGWQSRINQTLRQHIGR
ncbi:MAG: BrnA antitoxin family protein, partial [Candidatus Thioglobus sp.]|nr:BrnA antitoxin family protein [Candidatus Thioglobus sp.]